MIIKGQGSFKSELDHNAVITVRSQREFTVIVNDEIKAPNNALDRYAQVEVKKGDVVEIDMDSECKHTIVVKELPPRGEVVSSESKVEVIPEGELSMFDRLRSEMLGLVSQYAEAKGMDTYEDDNDYDDDDEEGLIDTPYEYEAMKDEYLAMRPEDEHEVPPAGEQKEEETTTKEEEVVS